MITVNKHILQPTIFPDKTSQVWHLPPEIVAAKELKVDWRFEEEREIIDLLSLRKLLPKPQLILYIPYLPYARQDKEVSNETTFNLDVFADLINSMNPTIVEAIDIHSWKACKRIKRLVNIGVRHLQQRLLKDIRADVVVYPDEGAATRYDTWHPNTLVLDKERDQATGKILGHKVVEEHGVTLGSHYLLLDDLCDGGATFLSATKLIRERSKQMSDVKHPKISLFTTHGIYSKGRSNLFLENIDLYTTDSLIHNRQYPGVYKV